MPAGAIGRYCLVLVAAAVAVPFGEDFFRLDRETSSRERMAMSSAHLNAAVHLHFATRPKSSHAHLSQWK